MSETVTVYRGVDTTDSDGNPIRGQLAAWGEFIGLIGSATAGEATDVGVSAAPTQLTIYLRLAEPSGILHTDLISIRGSKPLPIDGVVATWRNKVGEFIGEQITIKAV